MLWNCVSSAQSSVVTRSVGGSCLCRSYQQQVTVQNSVNDLCQVSDKRWSKSDVDILQICFSTTCTDVDNHQCCTLKMSMVMRSCLVRYYRQDLAVYCYVNVKQLVLCRCYTIVGVQICCRSVQKCVRFTYDIVGCAYN